MKHPLLALAWLCIAIRAWAQVELTVSLPQDQFLPGESIEAAVRIANLSSSPLKLGASKDWLRLNVEATENFIVNRTADLPDSGEFALQPSTRGTLRFDVQPQFDLSRPGRYRLTATLRVSPNEEVTSAPVHFEVFRGTRLWERPFSAPSTTPGEEGPRRKYLLQQATHLREVRLYIRVTDEEERGALRVIPIGKTVSFSRPACAVDRKSRLHTLHQISADTYRYHQVGPGGELLERRTYNFVDRRPQLRVNEAGEVAVIGGERRRSNDDLPAEGSSDTAPARNDPAPSGNDPAPKAR